MMKETATAIIIAAAILVWPCRLMEGAVLSHLGLVFEVSGQWSRVPRPDPDLSVCQASDRQEQITLRMMRFTKPIGSAERHITVSALVEDRQRAERGGLQGKVSFEATNVFERDRLVVATYFGVDQATSRPFAVLVLCSQDSAWVLFYETLDAGDRTFRPSAEKLFATIRESGAR